MSKKDTGATDFDAIVVGAGPNGLAAAITLQQKGLRVLLLEAKAEIGGGLRSAELTLPGFTHDICSAVHPLAAGSPFFTTLPLHEHGLEFIYPAVAAAHPFDDGTAAILAGSVEETARGLGHDADAYRQLIQPFVRDWPVLAPELMGPMRWPADILSQIRFGWPALSASTRLARRFHSREARGLLAGMAAHSMQPLSNLATSAIALVLMTMGHVRGWPLPRRGSVAIADALASYFVSLGGIIQTGVEVKNFSQLPSSRCVLLDLTPRQLLRLGGHRWSSLYQWQLERYRYGMGVFKIDWALAGRVPFTAVGCRRAGTIHIGNTLEEITAAEAATAAGVHPNNPFVLLAQPSVFDPSRAPAGRHTAWAYCHVPNGSKKDMTEEIERQVERFAPGFCKRILARHVFNTAQLEAYNANYVGGDINGGVIDIRQLFTRPALRWSPYRTSEKGIYICSSSTPPGGGVHGMCGYHAAQRALKDIFPEFAGTGGRGPEKIIEKQSTNIVDYKIFLYIRFKKFIRMADQDIRLGAAPTPDESASPIRKPSGWQEFWSKEDWWAVWLGLGIIVLACVFYLAGSSISWIAVAPAKWSTLSQLAKQFSTNSIRYVALLGAFLILFTTVTSFIGQRPKAFVPSFIFVFILSTIIYVAGNWDQASRYNLEPPLVALVLGLIISNVIGLPRRLDAGFRVELYVKLGIVLLGATLPFTLIIWAGPVAILQASIVSLVTFFTIFFIARKLGLDQRLAAVLGAGGAVCGVSASIAVAGAVRAKKEHPPIAISLVVFWAIILIFALPLAARTLHLPTGVGGAWIGTSEFADAAGLAAAQSYGGLAGTNTGIAGTADQALASYTLIKVIGRDSWIGIWSFVLALIAVTIWERTDTNSKVPLGQIWWRFPKFVIGFLVASVLTTVIVHGNTLADYNKLVKPSLIAPITSLRTWVFTFSFLSIGLTTRFRELANAGIKPFVAFTAGVIVNVILGYILSVIVFGHYWSSVITH